MRRDTAGRPPQNPKIKEEVRKLREAGLSFTEIGKALNISRQLAFYHYEEVVDNSPIDK